MLAHAGAADESLSVVLLFGALWVGWVGWSLIKGKAFPRLPAWAGPGLLAVAALLGLAAATVPRALFPAPPTPTASASPPLEGARPTSTASLAFTAPADGAVVDHDEVEVVLDLEGGHVVDGSSTRLTPDTGHVHLELDGALVSMTYGLVQVVDLRNVPPGAHTLRAEFVAADHAPFDPRVTAVARFETETA